MENGLFSSLYKKIPTNIRLAGEQVFGVSSPITEKDFTPEELSVIRQQIASKDATNAARETLLKQGLKEWTPDYSESLKEIVQKELKSYTSTKGKTAITYDEYTAGPNDFGWIDSVKQSFKSPEFRVATSLGQYVGIKQPDGSIKVLDEYDWDNERKLISKLKKEDYPRFIKNILQNPQSTIATIMASLYPTKKRKVEINLPKEEIVDVFKSSVDSTIK
jgi:hypothetical protein